MRPGPATQAALLSRMLLLPSFARNERQSRNCTPRSAMQRGPPEVRTPGLQFSVSIPPYGGFRRRPQRPGTSSLDMNRNSPGDSPSRKSPATLNSGRQRLETFSRFDWIALCPRLSAGAIANLTSLVQKLWSRMGSCGKDRKSRVKIHRLAKTGVVPRPCSAA